jgi:uncharacterized repeat protein (TIGR03803 family)
MKNLRLVLSMLALLAAPIVRAAEIESLFALDDMFSGVNAADIIADPSGTLYFTTSAWGLNGSGSLFSLAEDGTLTSIHDFDDGTGFPVGRLLMRSNVLYGASAHYFSGDEWIWQIPLADTSVFNAIPLSQMSNNVIPSGIAHSGPVLGLTNWMFMTCTNLYTPSNAYSGAVISIKCDLWGFALIAKLTNNSPTGWQPNWGVTVGANGSLYVPMQRSTNRDAGTIIRLDPTNYTPIVIVSAKQTDWGIPGGPLLLATDGKLYGTTTNGNGFGNAFRVETNGANYAVIHKFTGQDGSDPEYGLTEGTDGWLYGTTRTSTNSDCLGTAFRFRKDGTGFTILHRFTIDSVAFGGLPSTRLVSDQLDNWYGASLAGDVFEYGNIYQLTPSDRLAPLLEPSFIAGKYVVLPYTNTVPGSTYTLQSGTTFKDWANVQQFIGPDVPGALTITNHANHLEVFRLCQP